MVNSMAFQGGFHSNNNTSGQSKSFCEVENMVSFWESVVCHRCFVLQKAPFLYDDDCDNLVDNDDDCDKSDIRDDINEHPSKCDKFISVDK